MTQHSLTRKKYYSPLIGAALAAASLFQFSLPAFAAGTEAGEVLRNTATGTYKDEVGNDYTIESNTVEITVAKVAGITNQPTGIEDLTVGANNNSVLTGDRISFEFTINNVGNDISNIFIPALIDIATKGLSRTTTGNNENQLIIQVSPALTATGTHTFGAIPTGTGAVPDGRPTNGIVENVPINGKVIVKITGTVSATAAGAPIEVLLGNTGTNGDPNNPVAGTQNQPDAAAVIDGGDNGATTEQAKDVRTETATAPTVAGDPVGGQKEASALQQVFLGANPLAMTLIEKTRGVIQEGASATDLSDNIIPYNLSFEVLNTTPNSLYTPGSLQGRDFGTRITGKSAAEASNLILISDAIPAGTKLNAPLTTAVPNWTPVYTTAATGLPNTMQWTTTAPADLTTVTRIGWVYDARPTPDGQGPIAVNTSITGFTFSVITSGLNPTTGGTVANVAQIFGTTVNGPVIFDESGDQDPSNFNGVNPGPNENDALSTGIADPATHGVDSNNDNTATGSPGGEDNVTTISAPGTLINGPDGQPAATGNVFGEGPDNNHDFQNLGVSNFPPAAKHNAGTTFDPNIVTFKNTLSNPGSTDLQNVLLQPINPQFDPNFQGTSLDTHLPIGTEVTIRYGTISSTYIYQDNPSTPDPDDRIFVLESGSTPIIIPTLAAGVPLNYEIAVDLPTGTGLSTDDAINRGFPVPIVAFIDANNDGSPQPGESSNLTVNQVYTGFIKVNKQVRVLDSAGNERSGMGFTAPNTAKQPVPGDILEYRVVYRNISEPQVGNGTNQVLNGVNVMIDEDGTTDGNNWGLDNNNDLDLDTINVQNSATDTNGGQITFYTGKAPNATSIPISTLTSAGTTDPGVTVTGYRSTIPLLAPSGAETTNLTDYNAPGDSAFIFRRTVDKFDGLAAEGLEP